MSFTYSVTGDVHKAIPADPQRVMEHLLKRYNIASSLNQSGDGIVTEVELGYDIHVSLHNKTFQTIELVE